MIDTEAVLAQMTLEEKAALCTGASMWTTTPVERLGVPELTVSDGPHGVRRVPDIHSIGGESLPATAGMVLLALALLADKARLMLDAMGRSLVRLHLTGRRLLEWETSDSTERRLGASLETFLRTMWPAPATSTLKVQVRVSRSPGITRCVSAS